MIISSFYLLIFLLIFIGVIIYLDTSYHTRTRLKMQRTLFYEELNNVMLANWDRNKHNIRKILYFAAMFFISIALSDPRWSRKSEKDQPPDFTGYGTDIVIAVDVSKSMLASDLKPNRLENAKSALNLILNSKIISGNRVGLVSFAGSSFIQCPLTTDINALSLFVEELKPDLIPIGGTDIGGAIRTCLKTLGESPVPSKSIILITDGEDTGNDALAATEEAALQKVKIFTIGIGSELGETLPELDENGNLTGVKRDKNGNIVISRLDSNLIKTIAQKTGGNYYIVEANSTGNTNISSILSGIWTSLSAIPKQKIKFHISPVYEYKERFQIFLVIGILCLMGEFILSERKKS